MSGVDTEMDEKLRAADFNTRMDAVKFDLKFKRRVILFSASSEKKPISGSRVGTSETSSSESHMRGWSSWESSGGDERPRNRRENGDE